MRFGPSPDGSTGPMNAAQVSAVDTAKSANAQGLQTTENLLLSEANGATSGMIAKSRRAAAPQAERSS